MSSPSFPSIELFVTCDALVVFGQAVLPNSTSHPLLCTDSSLSCSCVMKRVFNSSHPDSDMWRKTLHFNEHILCLFDIDLRLDLPCHYIVVKLRLFTSHYKNCIPLSKTSAEILRGFRRLKRICGKCSECKTACSLRRAAAGVVLCWEGKYLIYVFVAIALAVASSLTPLTPEDIFLISVFCLLASILQPKLSKF